LCEKHRIRDCLLVGLLLPPNELDDLDRFDGVKFGTQAVPSRSTITNVVLRAAESMASRSVSSVTALMMVSLSGQPGFRLQRLTGWFGSASMIVTEAPRLASSVASSTAEVDLPAPPLELAKEMVGMDQTQIDCCCHKMMTVSRQSVN
jgi:hypothetical protein